MLVVPMLFVVPMIGVGDVPVVVVAVPVLGAVDVAVVLVAAVDVACTVTVATQVLVPLGPLAVARYVVVVVGNTVRVPEIALPCVLVPTPGSMTIVSAFCELHVSVENPNVSARDVGSTERTQVGSASVPGVVVAVLVAEVVVDCADANPLIAISAARTSIPSAIGGIIYFENFIYQQNVCYAY